MPVVEVSVPKRIDNEIDRLVEQEEFVNREQAVENLLTKGISVYDTAGEAPTEGTEEIFSQVMNDQRDPAMENDQ